MKWRRVKIGWIHLQASVYVYYKERTRRRWYWKRRRRRGPSLISTEPTKRKMKKQDLMVDGSKNITKTVWWHCKLVVTFPIPIIVSEISYNKQIGIAAPLLFLKLPHVI